MNHQVHNGRSVAEVLSAMKEDLKDFIRIRVTLLKTELKQKLQVLKIATPLAAAALLLLTTAYFLFTFALVGLVVAFFRDSAYRWCLAFFAVGTLWVLLGAIAAYRVKHELELRGLVPKKTLEVLRGDRLWIQSEMRNQL